MKVWLVMAHESAAEDDISPGNVERVFGNEDAAVTFLLTQHVDQTECGLEKVLPGTASYHPRKVPVASSSCKGTTQPIAPDAVSFRMTT